MLQFGTLSSAPPPPMFAPGDYLRPGSYFGPLNPNYQSVPNAFAPPLTAPAPPYMPPMPLEDPNFIKGLADAQASFAATRGGLLAQRGMIKPQLHQAVLRSRQDTRYNVGQSQEDFANRGVFESGGRMQAGAHIHAMGARNIQDLGEQAAAQYSAISQQLKQARLTMQQTTDQAAMAASQQAAANPMPIGNYQMGSAQRVVAVAHNQIGDLYKFGSEGPNQFDCSGLYWYSLNQAGIHVPRETAAQYYAQSRHVGKSQLRPGDAVYFSYGSGVDHMGIYAGNGFMIVAPHTGATVSYMRIDWPHFIGGGRIGHT